MIRFNQKPDVLDRIIFIFKLNINYYAGMVKQKKERI